MAPEYSWDPAERVVFHRRIKPEFRPVSAPDDPKVIVSANDGKVFKYEREVAKSSEFWLKEQPYSLEIVDHFTAPQNDHVERPDGGATICVSSQIAQAERGLRSENRRGPDEGEHCEYGELARRPAAGGAHPARGAGPGGDRGAVHRRQEDR